MKLIRTLSVEIVEFEVLKELYVEDDDFKKVWASCVLKQPCDEFYIHNGFLMKNGQLCLPRTYFHEKVIRNLHDGGLIGHFRRENH